VVETWCLESLTLLGTLQLPEEHITAMAVVPWTPFVLLGTARGRLHAVQCDSTGVPTLPLSCSLPPSDSTSPRVREGLGALKFIKGEPLAQEQIPNQQLLISFSFSQVASVVSDTVAKLLCQLGRARSVYWDCDPLCQLTRGPRATSTAEGLLRTGYVVEQSELCGGASAGGASAVVQLLLVHPTPPAAVASRVLVGCVTCPPHPRPGYCSHCAACSRPRVVP
jgi:hypothetical protein